MPGYLILGCGYTATRVARRLLAEGHSVVCTNRRPSNSPEPIGPMTAKAATANLSFTNVPLDLENPATLQQLLPHLSQNMFVLNSISATVQTSLLLKALLPFHPQRMLYISTTGVYGAAHSVDEQTTPVPNTERDRMRLHTEGLLASGPWSSLILRPAAIYGPGRGVHTSAHIGIFRPPPGGDRLISRIHVDDLAQHALAGLQSSLTGAFPVADEEPCPSSTVAALAFRILNVPFQTGEREPTARDERKTGRRVDGSAIRRALNLRLSYPTYREGVPACLEAEGPSPK